MNTPSLLSADTPQQNSPLSGILRTQKISRVGNQGNSFSSVLAAARQRGDTVTISEEGRALAEAMLSGRKQAATASALRQDTLAVGTTGAAASARDLAAEYRAALGMNEDGSYEVNRAAGEADPEALEAMQKELESLVQQMAELSAQAGQNPEARQAVAEIKQLINELQKQMKSGGAKAA